MNSLSLVEAMMRTKTRNKWSRSPFANTQISFSKSGNLTIRRTNVLSKNSGWSRNGGFHDCLITSGVEISAITSPCFLRSIKTAVKLLGEITYLP